MRERRIFAERAKVLKSDEAVKKYFLVYEGSDTEAIYFDAVQSMRDDIRINPLIQLIPLIRSYSEEGWSNPKKILDRLILNLRESQEQYVSYESLLNRIMDYLLESKAITTSKLMAKNIWQTMTNICGNKLGKELDDVVDNIQETSKMLLGYLAEEYEVVNIVADISEIIKNGDLTYDQDFDEICLIVDRDRNSFISGPENDQYQYVLDECKKFGFKFFVTNPNFEFWLLLHFDEVFNLDNDKLLANPKVSAKRRYTEYELCKLYKGYKKSSYKADELVRNIDVAVCNEKQFCEDINSLENSVGSNIGLLITEMQQG